jgi:TolB protein
MNVKGRFGELMILGLLMLAIPAGAGPAIASQAGSGPENALAPAGDWQPLEANESLWYTFHYAGDGSQVEVRLQVEPAESATFAVWTPQEVERRGLGLAVEPVGRGSADPYAPGSLVWAGSFTTPGAYYVVVERAGSQPGKSYYLLEVHGEGVSLSAPPATPESKPAPVKSQPKPAAPAKLAGKLTFQTSVGGDIYVIGVDGSGLQRIADGIDPTWSPDASQIAFVRWREPRGVWVVEADGSNEWRVFDGNQTRWPSWSADDSQILFSRQHGGRTEDVERCFFGFCFTVGAHPHWKLAIVGSDGSDFHEPLSSPYSLAPSWAPAGDRLVYADEQGLRVQNEEGDVSYLITHSAGDTSPIWSPDGRRLAFVRRQHDHWEVYAVNADGTNPARLTDTPIQPTGSLGNSVSPAWSPDGQYIAFLTDRTGRWEIWVMRADGSQQKPLFQKALEGLTLEYGFVGERALSWAR